VVLIPGHSRHAITGEEGAKQTETENSVVTFLSEAPLALAGNSYGSCRSLPWRFVGVGVPALVGLLGLVLMAAPP
jgi:hypothetical protein